MQARLKKWKTQWSFNVSRNIFFCTQGMRTLSKGFFKIYAICLIFFWLTSVSKAYLFCPFFLTPYTVVIYLTKSARFFSFCHSPLGRRFSLYRSSRITIPPSPPIANRISLALPVPSSSEVGKPSPKCF